MSQRSIILFVAIVLICIAIPIVQFYRMFFVTGDYGPTVPFIVIVGLDVLIVFEILSFI